MILLEGLRERVLSHSTLSQASHALPCQEPLQKHRLPGKFEALAGRARRWGVLADCL